MAAQEQVSSRPPTHFRVVFFLVSSCFFNVLKLDFSLGTETTSTLEVIHSHQRR